MPLKEYYHPGYINVVYLRFVTMSEPSIETNKVSVNFVGLLLITTTYHYFLLAPIYSWVIESSGSIGYKHTTGLKIGYNI